MARKPKEAFVVVAANIASLPPNEIRLAAAGLLKNEAGNLRTWLNKRENFKAGTTGRREDLEFYTEEFRRQGIDIDLTQLKEPRNYIVLARYTNADEA